MGYLQRVYRGYYELKLNIRIKRKKRKKRISLRAPKQLSLPKKQGEY